MGNLELGIGNTTVRRQEDGIGELACSPKQSEGGE